MLRDGLTVEGEKKDDDDIMIHRTSCEFRGSVEPIVLLEDNNVGSKHFTELGKRQDDLNIWLKTVSTN